MSNALRIALGPFGRVALLDMDRPLVRHAHSQCHVLLKVEGHDTQFDVGGRSFSLTDDSAVLINAWEEHSYAHRPGQPPAVLLALYIEPRWLGAFRSNWLRGSAAPDFFPRPSGTITPQIRAQVREIAEAMIHDPAAAEEHERMTAELMIRVIERMALWRQAAPSIRDLAAARPAMDRRVARAIETMRAAPGAVPSMDWLAKDSGASRAHFFRLFEASVGMSPRVYLNMVRIEHAVRSVAGSQQSLAAISDQLGFSAPAHFSRFFHDHAGSSPSVFRTAVALSHPLDTPAA